MVQLQNKGQISIFYLVMLILVVLVFSIFLTSANNVLEKTNIKLKNTESDSRTFYNELNNKLLGIVKQNIIRADESYEHERIVLH